MVAAINSEHTSVWGSSIVTYQGKEFKLEPLENFTIGENLDLIKVDIEASEYNLLDNSSDLKKFEWIIIEFHNHNHDYYSTYLRDKLQSHEIVSNTDCHFLLRKK